MGGCGTDKKSDDLRNNTTATKIDSRYYVTTIPGMMQLIQLQLNFICFMRSRRTTDCYFYYHKAGLFWFSLASATGLCMTGLLFLYYSFHLINRSNRMGWLLESGFSFAWASIYSAAVANVILSTQDYNERTVITPEFCASEDITSMHLVIWINASCRKLLIGGVLAIVAYGVDGTLKCYAFLTMWSLEQEIVAASSPPIDLRQLQLKPQINSRQVNVSKPPRPRSRQRQNNCPNELVVQSALENITAQGIQRQLSKENPISLVKELPVPLPKELPKPAMTNDLPTPLQSPITSIEEVPSMISKETLSRLSSKESTVKNLRKKRSNKAPPQPHARVNHSNHFQHHRIVIKPSYKNDSDIKSS